MTARPAKAPVIAPATVAARWEETGPCAIMLESCWRLFGCVLGSWLCGMVGKMECDVGRLDALTDVGAVSSEVGITNPKVDVVNLEVGVISSEIDAASSEVEVVGLEVGAVS